MSKHTASIVARVVTASLFALAAATPALAEVRLRPLTAPTPAVMRQPAASAAVEPVANSETRVTDGLLGCTRSGHRMVC